MQNRIYYCLRYPDPVNETHSSGLKLLCYECANYFVLRLNRYYNLKYVYLGPWARQSNSERIFGSPTAGHHFKSNLTFSQVFCTSMLNFHTRPQTWFAITHWPSSSSLSVQAKKVRNPDTNRIIISVVKFEIPPQMT